jgi:NitT/TauT family transport system permease protein
MHGLVPVALLVMGAVRNIRPILPRSARAMRLRPWQIVWTVLLPATLPDMLAALRLGFSLSLLGVLVGEMFASRQGLGFVVVNAVAYDDLPTILAVIVLLFGFAILVNQALAVAARRIQPGSP